MERGEISNVQQHTSSTENTGVVVPEAGQNTVPGPIAQDAVAGGASDVGNPDNNPVPQQAVNQEKDLYVPLANVTRIMRQVLPAHAKISDDAKETIQACVSEYIGFITQEAHEKCRLECRETVSPDDIIFAMSRLGFENYVNYLTEFRERLREEDLEHAVPADQPFVHPPGYVVPPMQAPPGHAQSSSAVHGEGHAHQATVNPQFRNDQGEGSSSAPFNP